MSVLISVRFCFVSDFSAIVGTAVSCSAAPFFLLALLFLFFFFAVGAKSAVLTPIVPDGADPGICESVVAFFFRRLFLPRPDPVLAAFAEAVFSSFSFFFKRSRAADPMRKINSQYWQG